MNNRTAVAAKKWMWPVLAVLVAAAIFGSAPARADGPGTDYLACRAEAWADYNACLVDARLYNGSQKACDLAWDLDNIGCDIALLGGLVGGLFKAIAR